MSDRNPGPVVPQNWATPRNGAIELESCWLEFKCGPLERGLGVLLQFTRPLLDPEFDAVIDEIDEHYKLKCWRDFGGPRPDLVYLAREDLAAENDPDLQLWLAQVAAGARARLTHQSEACRFLHILETNGSTITAQPAPWQRVTREGELIFDLGRDAYLVIDVANELIEGYADDSELDDTDGNIADEILALTPVESRNWPRTQTRAST